MKKVVKSLFVIVIVLGIFMFNSKESYAGTIYGVYPDKTSSYKGSSSSISPIGRHPVGNGITGTYPTRKGVILVTNNGSIGKVVGHAAIVYTSSTVVEALSSGVKVGKNNWSTTKSKVAAVTPRSTTTAQDSKVADYCRAKVGKPYNYNYYNMSSRSNFYCSHLIWAGYKDMYGINLNTSAYDAGSSSAIGPFEFVRRSGLKIFPIYMKNWSKDDVTE